VSVSRPARLPRARRSQIWNSRRCVKRVRGILSSTGGRHPRGCPFAHVARRSPDGDETRSFVDLHRDRRCRSPTGSRRRPTPSST
jgi:hypothetical protein